MINWNGGRKNGIRSINTRTISCGWLHMEKMKQILYMKQYRFYSWNITTSPWNNAYTFDISTNILWISTIHFRQSLLVWPLTDDHIYLIYSIWFWFFSRICWYLRLEKTEPAFLESGTMFQDACSSCKLFIFVIWNVYVFKVLHIPMAKFSLFQSHFR